MAMNAADNSEDRFFRLAGEDAPVSVAVAFAALGFLLATVASAQFMNEWRALPPAPAAPENIAAPPAAPATPEVKPEVKPAPAPETPVPAPPAPASPPVQAAAPPEAASVKAPNAVANPAPPPATAAAPAAAPSTAAPPAAPPAPPAAPPAAPAATPAPAAAAAPAPESRPPAVCLPIVSIPFDLNSARLKATGLDEKTAALRDWLLAHKGAILSVEGHADSTGPEAFNVLLSYKRAEAVAAWLVKAGAPAEQIATRAAGTRPPAHWTTEMQSNRQVILQIEGVEACRDDSAPARQP